MDSTTVLVALLSALGGSGVGGLAWKIYSDRKAERREREAKERARTANVEVKVVSKLNWGSKQSRAVKVAVINHGELAVRVVEVGCKEVLPPRPTQVSSERLTPPPFGELMSQQLRSLPRRWFINEGTVEDFPKQIPPDDGERFTVPTPITDPRTQDLKRLRPRIGPPIKAWATISTGATFYSPEFPMKPRQLRGGRLSSRPQRRTPPSRR